MSEEKKKVKHWKLSDFEKEGVTLTDEQKNFFEQKGSRFYVGGDTAEDALKSLKEKIEKSRKDAIKKKEEEEKKTLKSLEELKNIVKSIQSYMNDKGMNWNEVSKLIVDILNEETNNKIKEVENQLKELQNNLIK